MHAFYTGSNWNLAMFQFCGGSGTRVPREKPRSKESANSKLNSHIMMLGWNQTLATLVGGDCSQHCMIFAPYWFEVYWNGFPVNFSHGMVTLFALEWDWQDCSSGCYKNNIMATRHSQLAELVVSSTGNGELSLEVFNKRYRGKK